MHYWFWSYSCFDGKKYVKKYIYAKYVKSTVIFHQPVSPAPSPTQEKGGKRRNSRKAGIKLSNKEIEGKKNNRKGIPFTGKGCMNSKILHL